MEDTAIINPPRYISQQTSQDTWQIYERDSSLDGIDGGNDIAYRLYTKVRGKVMTCPIFGSLERAEAFINTLENDEEDICEQLEKGDL